MMMMMVIMIETMKFPFTTSHVLSAIFQSIHKASVGSGTG